MKTKTLNHWLQLAALVALIITMAGPVYPVRAAGVIRYVVPGGATSGTCSSWATACELRYALLNVAVSGDEIWVKAGTYTPAVQNGNRQTSFTLKNGVAIYGGFNGTETGRTQRDWTANVTILSGDLNSNDSGSTNNGENSYHVVYASGVTASTVLDGFTITGGNANDGASYNNGGGMYNLGSSSPTLANLIFSGNSAGSSTTTGSGGGMYNLTGSPTLTNVTFSNNTATGSGGMGGGLYTGDGPTLTNVTFQNNSTDALGSGGGMYNANGAARLSSVTFNGNKAKSGGGLYTADGPTLTNVTFTNNSTFASGNGGGMYIAFSSGPKLANVVFNSNTAMANGGGMYNQGGSPTLVNVTFSSNSAPNGGGMYSNNGSATLTNVVFRNNAANGASSFGGGMYNNNLTLTLTNVTFYGNSAGYGGGMANYTKCPTIANSILWGNSATYNYPQMFNSSCTPTVSYSDIYGDGYSGTGNINQDPFFVNPTGGDLHLQSGSPAVDAGSQNLLPADILDLNGNGNTTEPVPYDLDGKSRVSGIQVDMGAYELQQAQNVAPYVTLDPVSQTVTAGQTVAFTAAAGGTPTPTVQWQVSTDNGANWSNISGATSTTYSFTAQASQNGYQYHAVFTNTAGQATTNAATLTVDNPPVVEAGADQSVARGSPLALQATFTDAEAGDTHTAQVDWGDGNVTAGTVTENAGSGSVTGSHAYNATGVFTVRVTVTDNHSISGSDTLQASVIGVWYVKSGASGSGCTSWADACPDLQTALTKAQSGDQIWVAAGTYRPTALLAPPDPRTAAFSLKNGVAIYGGFNGTETDRSQRNWTTNVTILSGDLSGNDGPNFANNSENSYHVVYASGVTASTVLDGFTISGGNANGTVDTSGGGMWNTGSSNPTLANLIFTGNTATRSGGGMYNTSSPVMTSVTFSNNTTTGSSSMGGGMFNSSGNPTLTNVTFSNNSTDSVGFGGGLYVPSGAPVLTNVTFSGNSAKYGGGMYNAGSSTLVNSILWGNTATSGPQIYNVSGATLSITYSDIQGDGYSGTGNINADPLLAPLANYGGTMPAMALLPGSPAIDAGSDSSCPATDQRGVVRPQGVHCDMGAYESQGFTLTKTGGDNQSASINSTFATSLGLAVSPKAAGEPVNGGKVTFTPPTSGAGATLIGNPATITNGAASVTATANGTVGSYTVAAVAAGATSVSFSLTNAGSTAPAITTDPASQTVTVGQTARFTAAASGNPTPTAQWQVGTNSGVTWSDIPGATSTTLEFTAAASDNGKQYHAVFTNGIGSPATSNAATLTVNKLMSTVTVTSSQNPSTYGDTVRFTASVTSGSGTPTGKMTFKEGDTALTGCSSLDLVSGQATCEVSTFDAGTHTVTAEYAGDDTYQAGSGTLDQNVSKATATVTLSDLDYTYDGTPKAASVSITPSGLNVVVTYDGSAALPQNAGSYAVVATINDPNYQGTAGDTLKVNPVRLTVAANDASKLYGADLPSFSVSYAGFVAGETASVLGGSLTFDTSAMASSPVGEYDVTPAGLTSSNYTITFVKGKLTIQQAPLTIKADDKSEAYGEPNPDLTVTYSGFVLGQNQSVLGGSLTLACDATATSDVGQYAITPSGLTSSNYDIHFENGTLTINKADQAISFGALGNKTYGDADFDVSATARSGLLVSFNAGASDQCTISGHTVHITSAGSCTVTAAQEGNRNYNAATPVSQTFTIAKAAATVALDNLNQDYDGTPRTATVSTTPGGVHVDVSYDGNATAPKDAGSYAVIATINDPNYQGDPATGTLTINKVQLTVKADDKSRVYGQPNPEFTATYSGFVNGENKDVLSGAPSLSTGATADSPVGAYPITVEAGNLSAANYAFKFENGTLTINKANTTTSLSVSVSSALYHQPVTFTAVVAPVAPATGTPAGTVNFMEGTTTVAANVALVNGQAQFTTTDLSAGPHSITAVYSGDASWNGSRSAAVSVGVKYQFVGFTAPVENPQVMNIAKAGQAIPLKWRLLDYAGAPVTNLASSSVKVTAVSLSCSVGTSTDQIEEYAAGASGLQNLGDGYYQWNWKSPTSYANSCKTLKLDLGEGAGNEHTALFQFKK